MLKANYTNKGNTMNFNDLLKKGFKFTSERQKLQAHDIQDIELLINAKLPEQYRDYLLYTDGGAVINENLPKSYRGYATKIHWPKNNGIFPDEEYDDVMYLHSKEKIFFFYHNYKHDLPENTIVIGTDPGLTCYLIGVGKENSGKIYAWRIVPLNVYETGGVAGKSYLGFIANSFVEWILSLEDISGID